MTNFSTPNLFTSKTLLVLLALSLLAACSAQSGEGEMEPLSVATLASSPTPGPDSVTKVFDATEEEIAQLIQREASQAPVLYSERTGSYWLLCLLESISFLEETAYIHFGDYAITVIGNCSFLDVAGEKQTVPIALALQNSVRKTTWIPHHARINARLIGDNTQVFFTQTVGQIEPGSVISVAFGMQNEVNRELSGGMHNAFIASEVYKNGSDIVFAQTGDPAMLNGLLIPLKLVNIPLTQETP